MTLQQELIYTMVVNPDVHTPRGRVKVREIVEIITSYFNISSEKIRSEVRKKDIVMARHFAYYFTCEKTELSLKKIAYLFNRECHSSIMHGRDVICHEVFSAKTPNYVDAFNYIKSQL